LWFATGREGKMRGIRAVMEIGEGVGFLVLFFSREVVTFLKKSTLSVDIRKY
jgi:hypothetical protein